MRGRSRSGQAGSPGASQGCRTLDGGGVVMGVMFVISSAHFVWIDNLLKHTWHMSNVQLECVEGGDVGS